MNLWTLLLLVWARQQYIEYAQLQVSTRISHFTKKYTNSQQLDDKKNRELKFSHTRHFLFFSPLAAFSDHVTEHFATSTPLESMT
mmetsp:Transcript_20759/g.29844  ORF Transcript_20759/g.29844 Transcript_20759/m.29844 type:complete len:85 (+) Transcript_20759:85-339(+)